MRISTEFAAHALHHGGGQGDGDEIRQRADFLEVPICGGKRQQLRRVSRFWK